MNNLNKTRSSTRVIIAWLILFEVSTTFLMLTYKYWVNSTYDSIFSRSFLGYFFSAFDILYTGNLFWIMLCLISIIAIINISFHLSKVSESALRSLFVLTVVALIFLVIAMLQGSTFKESFFESYLSFSARGIQTIMLSVFCFLNILLCISYCVISFSALMKYYIFRSIWLTILIICLGYGIVFIYAYKDNDDYSLLVNNKKRVEAGTVLGAAVWGGNRPSPVLRERINKGYELYSFGIIKNIVLTGGGSPGEMTEAEVSKKELLKKGVNERDILIENKSNSTLEQISYLSNNLYKKNNWKDVVIISDNFHLLRTKQICRFFGVNAYTVASDTPLSTESTFNYCVKESFAVILFWLFGIG